MATLPTTGLTLHVDASDAGKLFTTYVSGGPHTGTPSDGSSIAVWEDETTTSRIFKQSGAVSLPVWRSTTPLMLLPCLDFARASNQALILTNSTGTNQAVSTIIANNAFTVLVAFYAETITETTVLYTDAMLMGESGGFWRIILGLLTGVPKIAAYNYNGNQDYVRLDVTAGASHIFMMRHQSGTLYASLDGGAESSVASGNTTNLTGSVLLGDTGTSGAFDGRIGEIAVYNTALTGSNLTNATTYFIEKWVTPPAPSSSERTQLSVGLG